MNLLLRPIRNTLSGAGLPVNGPPRAEGTIPFVKRRYLGLLVLLTIVDGLQTSQVVAQYGSIAEFNPIMRMALDQFSIGALWWVKAFAIAVVILTLHRIRPKVLLGSVVLMACVVTSNLVQMLMVVA